MKRKLILFLLSALMVFSLTGCAEKKSQTCIAIIAALESEENIISEALEDRKETELLSTPVFEGTIGEYRVVTMRCGMGKVSAGIGAQALIDVYHPDYVINTGCAGALSQDLDIGDVVLSDSVVEWDLDLRAIGYPLGYIDAMGIVEMEADAELRAMIRSGIDGDQKVVEGMIVSGDQFVSTNEQREYIRGAFPEAQCAEMEGAAVGHVCLQNKIPFCVIRTMSDNANGNSGVDYAEFSVEAGQKSASWLLAMLKKK